MAKRRTKRRKHTATAAVTTVTATKRETPSGAHKWTLHFGGVKTITTTTSTASVSMISEIGRTFAPALKRLAKE